MATKRRKRRKSCKNGKLKRPVRTKKGGRRRCKKGRKTKRKSRRKRYCMYSCTNVVYGPTAIRNLRIEENIVETELEDGRLNYTINFQNAYVHIIVGREQYPLTPPITFDLILAHLYSQWDEKQTSAPKGLTRKLLCELLLELIRKNIIKNNSVILLEAEPSKEEKLLTMYQGMGFKIRDYIDQSKFEDIFQLNLDQIKTRQLIANAVINEQSSKTHLGRGAIMTSTVKEVINWCNDKYKL